VHITAQGPRLRNDLYCVECDVKLYYTVPYHLPKLIMTVLCWHDVRSVTTFLMPRQIHLLFYTVKTSILVWQKWC